MSEPLASATDRPPEGPDHEERFDPEARLGELTGSEHLARYLWAGQVVSGKRVLDAGCGLGYGSQILAEAGGRVTGVDLAADAIDECVRRVGDAAEFRVADVTRLPFEPSSFDAVVCFEVIEHVEDRDVVLDELERVLQPGGVAIVSSPNRGVYPAGNPHHVFEYTSQELLDSLGERFAHAALHRQHPWLASRVEPSAVGDPAAAERLVQVGAARTQSLEQGAETYAIVVAGNAELPSMDELVVMGDAFEVRWFHERIDWQDRAERELTVLMRDNAMLRERERETAARLELAGRRLLAVEAENARIAELEQEIEAFRAIRSERDALAWRLDRADRVHSEMKSSISWRLTAPLRVLVRLFREPSQPTEPPDRAPSEGRGNER